MQLNDDKRSICMCTWRSWCSRMVGVVWVIACLVGLNAQAEEGFIVVASTTSTEDSGLFEYLLLKFEKKTGIEVPVVAAGTGEAIVLAEHGDADVLFVHHKPSEEAFVAESCSRICMRRSGYVLCLSRHRPRSDVAKQRCSRCCAGSVIVRFRHQISRPRLYSEPSRSGNRRCLSTRPTPF
jgi:hypothetical protein